MIKRTIISALLLAACTSTAVAGPNCTCRFQGENFQIGEVACILGQLKQCEMQLNNTSWRTLSEGCPQAQLLQTQPHQSTVTDGDFRTSAPIGG
ncbi:MAG: hypothetical protein GY948_07475 [Alphaproteobacteria bacterium]|nr:hypothetical protein [Alphaproteobacteria bacterium]